MPITCMCPQCQKTLAISEQFAGQPMRCPLCMALFQSPPLQPAGAPAAPAPAPRPDAAAPWTASHSAAMRGPAPETARMPPPASAAELEELRNGTAGRLPAGWHMVRRGLSIIPTALIVSVFALLACWSFILMADPGPRTYQTVMLLTVPVTVLAMIVAIIGGALCCLVPRDSGLHKLALPAAGCLLGALLVALLTFGVRASSSDAATRANALAPGAFWPAGLLAFAGAVVFLFFLRGVARHFKSTRLAQTVLWCIGGVGASPLLFLFLYMLLAATNSVIGGKGDGLGIIAGLVLYIIIGADLIWFLNVLGEVRQTIEKGYLGATA